MILYHFYGVWCVNLIFCIFPFIWWFLWWCAWCAPAINKYKSVRQFFSLLIYFDIVIVTCVCYRCGHTHIYDISKYLDRMYSFTIIESSSLIVCLYSFIFKVWNLKFKLATSFGILHKNEAVVKYLFEIVYGSWIWNRQISSIWLILLSSSLQPELFHHIRCCFNVDLAQNTRDLLDEHKNNVDENIW